MQNGSAINLHYNFCRRAGCRFLVESRSARPTKCNKLSNHSLSILVAETFAHAECVQNAFCDVFHSKMMGIQNVQYTSNSQHIRGVLCPKNALPKNFTFRHHIRIHVLRHQAVKSSSSCRYRIVFCVYAHQQNILAYGSFSSEKCKRKPRRKFHSPPA